MNFVLLVPLFLLGNLKPMEIVVIAVVILLVFGGRKIPELMRGLGKGIRGFKEGLNGMTEEINRPVEKPGEKTDATASAGGKDADK